MADHGMRRRREKIQWSYVRQFVLIAAAAAAAVPGTATAFYYYTFPTTLCRYYAPLAGDTYFNPSGLGANGIKNTSSSAKYVTCPLTLRDDSNTLARVRDADINMSSSAGTCQLWGRGYSGGSTAWWGTTSVDGGGSAWTYHFYPWPDYQDCTLRSCSIYCSVPAGATMASYRYVPWDAF